MAGTFRVSDIQNSTNLPNTENAAWFIFSNIDEIGGILFGFQLAVGYYPQELYFRVEWSGFSPWRKII